MQHILDLPRLPQLVATLMLLVASAFGQGTSVPNDYQIGFPANGEFIGSDFESVQMNNNNLHIDVPLWSLPGRRLPTGQKYVYDSKGWGFNEHCNARSGTCTDTVSPQPGSHGAACCTTNNLEWSLVSTTSLTGKSTRQTANCNAGNVFVYSYNLGTPDGTHHHFVPDPVGPSPSCSGSWTYATTVYADDGSGWTMQVDPVNGGSITKIIRKDGAITASEDSNGNQITTTDTLGRQIPSTPSYYDSNGVLRTIQVTSEHVAVQSNLCQFSSDDFCNEYSSTFYLPQIITLPNGMSYTFTYDQGSPTHPYYGQPLSVSLPTGGQITWGWSGEGDSGPILVTRQLSGDPAPWKYGGAVTDPAGNDTVYTCTPYSSYNSRAEPPPCYITMKRHYQGSSTSGILLKTEQTDYQHTNTLPILPIHEITTWNQQNLVSRTETDYDSWPISGYTGFSASASNPVEKREYDYGTGAQGALIRTTDYGYLHLSNSTYLGLNIVNKETSLKVYAGSSQSGTLVAQTLSTYDGVAIAGNTSGNPAPNHDYTNFPASYNYRGNLTQISKGLKSGSSWSWLNTNNTYNDLGEVLTSTDPANNTTTYAYTDSWASISNPQCVTATASYGFATTITDALNHRTKHTFYSCSSLVGSTQDENDIAASRPGITYSYDLLDRMSATSYPDGGQTTASYNDAIPYTQTASQLITSGMSKVTATVHDGLGRVQETQLVDPNCSSGPVKVDYTYGYSSQGQQTQVSTPYCGSPGGTYGLMMTTNFDALDRSVSVQQTDGSTTTTSYAGNCQTVTDEVGKARQSCSDALGRLTGVLEDPGSLPHLNYETDYGYDVLNDVIAATQKGGATSSSWRFRSFTYDSLARLTCAANPEITPGLSTVNPASCPATYNGTYTSGTIGHSYDADDNLITRTAPAPNQTSTSSTVTTTYTYDKVNRLTAKTYTGTPATPAVLYGYDGIAVTGCSTTPPTVSDSNPVGARTSMCDGSGATSWTHDAMARILLEQRIINGTSGINKNVQYTYYADGEIDTLAYPGSGPTVTYTPNSAARTLSAADSSNNYVTSTTYAPHGAIASMTYGGAIYASVTYNSRLQPLQLAYGTSQPTVTGTTCPQTAASIMQRIYDFHAGSGDNGLVQAINNCRDTNRTQNFFYDSLNRITQAYTNGNSPLTTSWGETFTIDPWGNLTNKAGVSGKTNSETLNVAPATTKNQLTGLCNDASGNLVLNSSCPTGTFTPTYSYDIENRLTSAAAGYTYIYDGDGKRVKKCINSGCTNGTLYWTGTGSDPLAETGFGGSIKEEYIFFAGKRIARVDVSGCSSNCVHYYFSDHLGSADVITDSQGNVQKESDYYPYGGEIVVSGSDANNYKFSGKERDSESGLDNFGARYNAASLGRFMTPDWAARPTAVPYAVFGDPQSLNLYGFVRNDPVSRADADGHVPGDDAIQRNDNAGTGSGAPVTMDPQKKPKPGDPAQDTQSATSQGLQGGGKILLGIGLVGTAAFGDAPGGVAGALILTSAVIGGTATAVSGTVDVLGATTKTDVSKGQEALEATGNLPGLVTTVATRGNLKAGQTAGTLGDMASLAASPKEAVKNVATFADAVRTLMGAKDLATSVWNSAKSYLVNPGPPTIPTPGPPQ